MLRLWNGRWFKLAEADLVGGVASGAPFVRSVRRHRYRGLWANAMSSHVRLELSSQRFTALLPSWAARNTAIFRRHVLKQYITFFRHREVGRVCVRCLSLSSNVLMKSLLPSPCCTVRVFCALSAISSARRLNVCESISPSQSFHPADASRSKY